MRPQFFFQKVQNCSWPVDHIPFQRRERKLPKDYWVSCAVRPATWLFPGQKPDSHLDGSTVQRFLVRLSAEAKLPFPVSPHCIRHTFATHLLEDQVDLRTIQAILGHSNIQTTGLYLHVATHHLRSLVNPLDRLIGGEV